MYAGQALRKIFGPALSRLDARLARNLLQCVDALLAGRRLTLTELARHWTGAARIAAPLKRVDRLLGNGRLHALRSRFYQVAWTWLLCSPEPVIVVDWSELKSDGRWHLLRAGRVARGRTLTVYEEVHPQHRKNSPKVEATFLKRLAAWMPPPVKPIVVTDAGFHVPWFRAVARHGWHWLGRVGGRTQIRAADPGRVLTAPWRPYKTLFAQARGTPTDLGAYELAQSQQWPCRLVVVKRLPKGRRQRRRDGQRARGGHATKMARRNREPWVLAASPSLHTRSAGQIVTLYAKRMQIEQSFRDLKSHRYGCAFEDTLTRTGSRLEVLLLIHLLATLAAWMQGLADQAATNLSPSKKLRRRYSAVWLGWQRLAQTAKRLDDPFAICEQRLRWLVHQASAIA